MSKIESVSIRSNISEARCGECGVRNCPLTKLVCLDGEHNDEDVRTFEQYLKNLNGISGTQSKVEHNVTTAKGKVFNDQSKHPDKHVFTFQMKRPCNTRVVMDVNLKKE